MKEHYDRLKAQINTDSKDKTENEEDLASIK